LVAGRELHAAAANEAFEEAGVRGRVCPIAFASYLHAKPPKQVGTPSKLVEVVLFPLEVDVVLGHWPEMDLRERRWFPVDDTAKLEVSEQLRKILSAFVPSQALETQLD
jgi:8-oxo-dGTP pyrophosphatase MutT (NUDIX family)